MGQLFDFTNETGKKRIMSRNFREKIIVAFLPDGALETERIVLPTDFLVEICLLADLPPCYFLTDNNMEINPDLIHNEDVTDIVIREAV